LSIQNQSSKCMMVSYGQLENYQVLYLSEDSYKLIHAQFFQA